MSEAVQSIIIQTGHDPRSWPEFDDIRAEINKMNHPSQPEVSWDLIESLALTLFRSNGVDLHTAVYYTLARTHKHGLEGFVEGCELLSAMVTTQWEQLWPEQPQARTEILEWFNARVSAQLRQYSFSRSDLQQVNRAEHSLQLLCDKLQQVELKRLPRIENLLYLMQNTANRLDKVAESEKLHRQEPARKKTMVYLSVPDSPPQRSTYTAPENQPQKTYQPGVEVRFVTPVSAPKRSLAILGFAGGVFFSAILATLAYFAWIKPEQQKLDTLANSPEGAAQLWIHQPNLATYAEQLAYLEKRSPVAGLQTADSLVARARSLWPADAKQQAETQHWERLIQARAALTEENRGYDQIQHQLQALSDKLIEQEKAHGGLTISYLKTAVYQMQTELNRELPLEELLRQYAGAVDNHQSPSPELTRQIDERLNSLLSRYHQLMPEGDSWR